MLSSIPLIADSFDNKRDKLLVSSCLYLAGPDLEIHNQRRLKCNHAPLFAFLRLTSTCLRCTTGAFISAAV